MNRKAVIGIIDLAVSAALIVAAVILLAAHSI